MEKDRIDELEWNSNSLSRYVRILNQSWPGDNWTIGNPKTGKTIDREDHNNFNEGKIGTEQLVRQRFVQSFPKEEAIKILKKVKHLDSELQIMHNFDWYNQRLMFIENIITKK